jgi:hypothetical protein
MGKMVDPEELPLRSAAPQITPLGYGFDRLFVYGPLATFNNRFAAQNLATETHPPLAQVNGMTPRHPVRIRSTPP